jgi:hypothetical protein
MTLTSKLWNCFKPTRKIDVEQPGQDVLLSRATKMPVSVDVGIVCLQDIAQKGWYTEGEMIQINGRQYLWYILDQQKVPSSPDDDWRGEYMWERVLVEDIVQRQTHNWMVRNICSKTNRIWVCKRRNIQTNRNDGKKLDAKPIAQTFDVITEAVRKMIEAKRPCVKTKTDDWSKIKVHSLSTTLSTPDT